MNPPDVLTRYRRAERLAWRNIAGEVIVIHPDRGLMFPLNPAASRIWELLDGSRGSKDIAGALETEFAVNAVQARRDADAFITELVREGLVVAAIDP